MQEYLTHSEAETEQAGADFARTLPDGTVVAMYGELGSGKTAFVRGMARGMGLTCRVSSHWSRLQRRRRRRCAATVCSSPRVSSAAA